MFWGKMFSIAQIQTFIARLRSSGLRKSLSHDSKTSPHVRKSASHHSKKASHHRKLSSHYGQPVSHNGKSFSRHHRYQFLVRKSASRVCKKKFLHCKKSPLKSHVPLIISKTASLSGETVPGIGLHS